jgi:hypothetical protein
MEGGDITVASDIYSLVRCLYRPAEWPRAAMSTPRASLEQAGRRSTRRSQRKPSQVGARERAIAHSRSAGGARGLHGDLDDIVLKCLRLEPDCATAARAS